WLRQGAEAAWRGRTAGVLARAGKAGGTGRVAGFPGARRGGVRGAGRRGGLRRRDRTCRAQGLAATVRRGSRSVRMICLGCLAPRRGSPDVPARETSRPAPCGFPAPPCPAGRRSEERRVGKAGTRRSPTYHVG